ncbi:MAG: hypothetical protein HY709_04585 [Candidatus Latescibacteria bacterium]|nr:hypothetical protein [Candidatus Latescibacterota bacterium]
MSFYRFYVSTRESLFSTYGPLFECIVGYLLENRLAISLPLISPEYFSASLADLLRPVRKEELIFPYEVDGLRNIKMGRHCLT